MLFLSADNVGTAMRTSPFIVGDNFPSSPGVYFLRVMGFVKIGHTADFAQRFIVIDRMLPQRPEVLAFIEAPRSLETTIHRILQDCCLKNEWYPDCAAVRDVMACAQDGRLGETGRNDAGRVRAIPDDVKWASDALKLLASPVGREEPIRLVVERAASRAGFSYWRTFDLWYAKARRLEESERAALSSKIAEGAHV